ncbi:MAG: hypothetical protein LBE12_07055 [Planctomycetaceae bacterium]|jgi:hypothetical protein|nr:hypothetical protein [Planctomycetaceae bacterium]
MQAAPENTIFITFANRENEGMKIMLENAKTQGIFVNIINNDKFKDYHVLRQKNYATIDYLKNEADTQYKFVIFFDAFDTLFLRTKNEILKQFNDFYDGRIVLLPDYQYVMYPNDKTNVHSEFKMINFQRKFNGGRYRAMCMNSGFFAGERNNIIETWQQTWKNWDDIVRGEKNELGFPFDYYHQLMQTHPDWNWKDDDQLALNFQRFLNPENFKVDYEKELVTVFGAGIDFERDRRKLSERRKPTELNPLFSSGCIGDAAIIHMAGTAAGAQMKIAYRNALVKV